MPYVDLLSMLPFVDATSRLFVAMTLFPNKEAHSSGQLYVMFSVVTHRVSHQHKVSSMVFMRECFHWLVLFPTCQVFFHNWSHALVWLPSACFCAMR